MYLDHGLLRENPAKDPFIYIYFFPQSYPLPPFLPPVEFGAGEEEARKHRNLFIISFVELEIFPNSLYGNPRDSFAKHHDPIITGSKGLCTSYTETHVHTGTKPLLYTPLFAGCLPLPPPPRPLKDKALQQCDL